MPLFLTRPASSRILPSSAFCAESGKMREASSESAFAVVSTMRCTARSISSGVFSSSHIRSILLSTAIFCGSPGFT